MAVISRKFELLLSAKNNATKAITSVISQLKKSGETVDAINSKFNLLLGAAVTQRVVAFVKSTVDANDALNDMADRTGVSVENLSKLSEVAKAGDTSVETLTKAFNKLNLQALDSPKVFESLGISVLDASGKMKNSEQLFSEVADRIASVENPARRAAIATQVFGKAGLELMPILKNGSAGIKGWANDAERLGAVTSTSLATASGEFNDNIQRMQMAAKGFSNALSAELLPGLNLMASSLIETAAESIGFAKGNAASKKSIEDLAKSEGFNQLYDAIGFIGDAMQGLTDVGKGSLGFVRGYVGQIVNQFVRAKEMLVVFTNKNMMNQLAAVQEQFKKQQEEIKKEFDETWDGNFTKERFSDKLKRGLELAVTKSKEAAADAAKGAKESAEEIGKLGTIGMGQALRVTNGANDQIKSLAKVTDEASAKSKKALEDQKKVAEEFEKLSKQLKASTPAGGSLERRLANASKNEQLRGKENAALNKIQAKKDEATSTKKLERLQKEADATAEAYKTTADIFTKSKMDKAAEALKREQTSREEAEEQAELQEVYKGQLEQEISVTKLLEIRAIAANELNDIYLQVKENSKSGDDNGIELARLKKLGEELQKNKDEATGVFSQTEIENYATEIEALAKKAATADADAAKTAADDTFASAKARFEELQNELLKVKLGFDDEALVSAAEKALDVIQSKMKAIEVPVVLNVDERGYQSTLQKTDGLHIQLPANYSEPIKRAEGGPVRGKGTSMSDSIPALLSDNEFVVRSKVMKKRGMRQLMEYINAGGDMHRVIGTRRATGGSVGSQLKTPSMTGGIVAIDLRTNQGNMRVNGSSAQDQLDINAALRKQNLRHR